MTETVAPTASVPTDQLRTLLRLLEESADLREREIADAYRRGYLAGSLDPELLRATWACAWETAQDRLAAAMLNEPDLGPGIEQRVAQRRAAMDAWVQGTGPYPRWTS